jgi:hypothetical protein
MSRQVHEIVTFLAGKVDEVDEILKLAADLSDGQIDDPETLAAAKATYEVLGRLIGKVA